MTYRTLRRFRPAIQAGAGLLFLALLLATRRDTGLLLPAGLFFRLDPLVALAAMIAARAWIAPLFVSLLVVGLSVVLGRVWCGWLCPLGTVLDLFPLRKRHRRRPPAPAAGWRRIKYVLLLAVLAGAAAGSLALVPLDPITLLTRGLAAGLFPVLNVVLRALDGLLYGVPLLQEPVEWLEVHVRLAWFADQPFYGPTLLVAAILAGVIALNLAAPRFWCRYLCPLGGLLGMVSRLAVVRRSVDPACTSCGRCARTCPTGTIDPARGFRSDPAECTVCLDCVTECPRDGVRFGVKAGFAAGQVYDPSRRAALASLAAGAGAAALFQIVPRDWQVTGTLIRPPGAQGDDFWARCVRCGECMRICPTSGLQPALWQAGPDGWSSPVLVPRTGYCDYGCHACGQVCPTGAIPPLTLEEKRQAVIGVAEVDRKRCLPWAEATPCIVCEEMCPLPDKAIELEEAEAIDATGQAVVVLRPHVLRERCIGCGICEFRCPLQGQAAIRVSRAPSPAAALRS